MNNLSWLFLGVGSALLGTTADLSGQFLGWVVTGESLVIPGGWLSYLPSLQKRIQDELRPYFLDPWSGK